MHTLRGVVADSWRRSMAAGVDADHGEAPVSMAQRDLVDYRSGHLLAPVFPLLYDVLGRAAEASDSVMAVGDDEGRLLWVVGRPAAQRQAEGIRFVEGADWRESSIGTNAPGTAIRLDSAVQISSREHFHSAFKDWSCSAAPIHHPETHEILGVVDITGTGIVDTPQTLAMVRAAARMAESELGRLLLQRRFEQLPSRHPASSPVISLSGLGRPDLQIEHAGGFQRLSRRHSDILAVLADQPEGMSCEQLTVEIYDEDVQPSTMRAQMTRLRGLLGSDFLHSRPYRIAGEVMTDWSRVLEALRDNRIGDALQLYRGPLLPVSEAPGVVERRHRIERELTRALLASDNIDLLAAATRSRWASDNLELWERQTQLLGPSSPLRAASLNEVRRLREEYAIPPMRLPNRLHRL